MDFIVGQEFIVGQRWSSHAEPDLGLGIVAEIEARQVIISYPAVGENRAYSRTKPPISRIHYRVGDQLKTNNEEMFTVTEIHVQAGLYAYEGLNASGETVMVPEWQLDSQVRFSTPLQRLISGQVDHNRDYILRAETLRQTDRIQQLDTIGLMGARTELLPHQIHISQEVAKRFSPRVMLADEVGLGKTIEAGMIMHHQHHTGQASKVLIVLPDSLVHQWFVEMLRRFHLHFSIFDLDRIESLVEEGHDNPFEAEQLIITTLSMLVDHEKALDYASAIQWDLLVIDEAHHLHWNETAPSPEYRIVEQLSKVSKGLLLLTATPEQVGYESHFARLRLLDPARYHSFSEFKKESDHYCALNDLVQRIIALNQAQANTLALSDKMIKEIAGYLGEQWQEAYKEEPSDNKKSSNIETGEGGRHKAHPIIRALLDRHGTGRSVYRNTRAALKGFPGREVKLYPLKASELYSELDGPSQLMPEVGFSESVWTEEDSRVEWLKTLIKGLKPAKVLVICHSSETAKALDKYFNLYAGIRSTAFYEGLSLVERDRAAAYFADEEMGARTLVCSEIGSEGRNFQFVHHLVLFDLPLSPDLIEQRIGRLDRIGQKNTIHIHVPYLEGTAQEVIQRWYHEGLNQLEQTCSSGFTIYEKFSDQLNDLIATKGSDQSAVDQLISETKAYRETVNEQLNSGRNALLELNSCNLETSTAVIEAIRKEEGDDQLSDYLELLFDRYGLEYEGHSDATLVLRPTDHMRTDHFPGLNDEALTVTFDRKKALKREDYAFLTWEHPLVTGAMDMVLSSEFGNTTVATMKIRGLPPGTLLMETWFTLETIVEKRLQLSRFLPITPRRFLVDPKGKNLSAIVGHDQLNSLCEPIKRRIAQAVLQQARSEVDAMLEHAEALAEKQLPELLSSADTLMKQTLGEELSRIRSLKAVNPDVRDSEIEHIEQRIEASSKAINKASLVLQAVRVVVIGG